MIRDYIRFALEGIRNRSLRSWLTTIGIFIGIMSVVALISLGQGLQETVNSLFSDLGGDIISVQPGGGGSTFGPPAASSLIAATLDDSDLSVVKKVRGVDSAIGATIFFGEIGFKGETEDLAVFAAPTDAKSQDQLKLVDYYKVEKGRYLNDADRFKAIVGPDTGQDLFGRDIGLGDKITVKGYSFEVVGINKKTGTPFQDAKVTIPLETGQDIFERPDELSIISVKVKKTADLTKVAEDIEDKLRRHRNVDEGEEDFSVSTPQNTVGILNSIITSVNLFVIGIAAISLFVGMVGITTTMYTSILERTRQIGILKAIGARNTDILGIFVAEAGLLGLAGGIIGTTLGVIIGKTVEVIAAYYDFEIFKAYITAELILGALLFSFLIGCLAGYFPARRASRMNPVDALNYR